MSKLSFSQRVHNAAGSQAVENCHARHTYLHAKAFAAEEWGNIWSASQEVSWAHFFGRMRGWKSVWYGSVSCYDAKTFENYLYMFQKFPEIGGKDPRPINEASVHALVSDVIEVAEDGMSARSTYITPGIIFSNINDDGKRFCNYMWERYGSDYVYEDGCWVYLHEQVCPDIMAEFDDLNWARKAYQRERSPGGMGMPPHGNPPIVNSSPVCQDPGPLHNDYNPLLPVQDTVPAPRPYAAMNIDNTYSSFSENPEEYDAAFEAGLAAVREGKAMGPGGPGMPPPPPGM